LTSVFILLIFLMACCITGCEKEEDAVGVVTFLTKDQVIRTDNLIPVTFDLNIDPPAPVASFIVIYISSTGDYAGTAFTSSPGIAGGKIELHVNAGDKRASFTITPVEERIGYSNIVIDLEITDTGEGLYAGGLTGVYSSLTIINTKDQGRSLPFIENFDDCDLEGGSGSLPAGWEEVVIQQNSLGTGHWVCSPAFEGIECNAFSMEGGTGDSCEIWLLTPPVILSDAIHPTLTFNTDRRFETNDFQEYDIRISPDYNGANFYIASWEVFAPAVSAIEANDPERDNYETISDLDLSAYNGEVVTIAFIYYAEGSKLSSTIFRLDNIKIAEGPV